ncbi:MAG: type II toxin-antitoxin system RelB/DinJ family antitoxin [Thermoplasmata archaeon]|nr:type II toxin-antitoxin system RelB/DinJ family antitoxin [Thermoplasmata archaeon]
MSEYVSVTMRIDKDLKLEAQRLFSELGMDMTTAYNIFLVQAVRTQSIPFRVALDVPNQATTEALEDTAGGRNLSRRYSDVDDLMRDLDA